MPCKRSCARTARGADERAEVNFSSFTRTVGNVEQARAGRDTRASDDVGLEIRRGRWRNGGGWVGVARGGAGDESGHARDGAVGGFGAAGAGGEGGGEGEEDGRHLYAEVLERRRAMLAKEKVSIRALGQDIQNVREDVRVLHERGQMVHTAPVISLPSKDHYLVLL